MPISIVYRTYLDGLITSRKYVKIQYFTDLHELITINALIKAITTDAYVELLTVASGTSIPLNQLVSAGGQFTADYDGYQLYCDTCDC